MLSIMAPNLLILVKSNLATRARLLYFDSTCRQRSELTCVYMCTNHTVISSTSGTGLILHLTYVTRHQQCDHTQILFCLDWLLGSNLFCSFPNSIRKKAQENWFLSRPSSRWGISEPSEIPYWGHQWWCLYHFLMEVDAQKQMWRTGKPQEKRLQHALS